MACAYCYQYALKLQGAYTVGLDRARRLFVTVYDSSDSLTESTPVTRFELGELAPPPVIFRKR